MTRRFNILLIKIYYNLKANGYLITLNDILNPKHLLVIFIVFYLFFSTVFQSSFIGLILGTSISVVYFLAFQRILMSELEQLSHAQIDTLISNFVKIHQNELNNNVNIDYDKMKLIDLLRIKFNKQESIDRALNVIIRHKLNQYNKEHFETYMMSNNPKTYQDYINNYINTYYNDLSLTLWLSDLMKKNDVDYNKNNINKDIASSIKKREIEKYEQNLLYGIKKYTINDAQNLSGKEFEIFLKQLFNNLGYQVENLRHTKDQGADLIISKFGERIAVQAKRYSGNVGNSAIQEIVAAIKHYNTNRGMVITTSYFTSSAVELAKSNNIELIDRDKLENLINRI